MEREIEIKVLDIDVEEMVEKLENLGAKKLGVEYQTNHIYDSKERPIEDGYLRIRERMVDGEKLPSLMTFKKHLTNDGVRVNNECTTKIDSVAMTSKILEQLGYVEKSKANKKRISYAYESIRFDIDTWEDPSYPDPYMEIEMANVDELDKVLAKLDIDKAKVSTASISDLIDQKK